MISSLPKLDKLLQTQTRFITSNILNYVMKMSQKDIIVDIYSIGNFGFKVKNQSLHA